MVFLWSDLNVVLTSALGSTPKPMILYSAETPPLSQVDPRNDSQMIFYDQLIPGTILFSCASTRSSEN
jgi:hypothetical protein